MPGKRKKKRSPVNSQKKKKTKGNSQRTMAENGGHSYQGEDKNKTSDSNCTYGNSTNNNTAQASQLNNTQTNQTLPQMNTNATNSFLAMLNSPPQMVNMSYPVQANQQPYVQYQQPYQHCSTPLTTIKQPSTPDMFTVIIQRLDSLDSKMSQLDSIQSSVKGITSRMDKMEQRIKNMEGKMKELENSKAKSNDTEVLSKKQKEIDSALLEMKKMENEQKEKENRLKEEVLDLKCRSMRDNLVFYKIQEEKDENCEEKILNFIEDKLQIENAKNEIRLHRAHRMGAFKKGHTRPIVAKFAYYPDRERVRKSSNKLKATHYAISEQFPKEIIERRRALLPIMKEARKENKLAYLVVDRLFIDGQLYQGKE